MILEAYEDSSQDTKMDEERNEHKAGDEDDDGAEEKLLCLTLDLENDWYYDDPSLDHLTLEYLDRFITVIQELNVPLTVFVVGKTLEKYPEKVDILASSVDCEFHLHSYQHDVSKSYEFQTEIDRGIESFKNHFGREPIGYRAPQGNIDPEEFRILEEKGFAFDSSVFPSYRPRVYNNLDAPIEPYIPEPADQLLEVPIGAMPGTRIPAGHSYLKLFGRPYLMYLTHGPLPDLFVYNVHLHDLYRTESHDRLPTIKRMIYDRNMREAESLLMEAIERIRDRGYTPIRLTEYLQSEVGCVELIDGGGLTK